MYIINNIKYYIKYSEFFILKCNILIKYINMYTYITISSITILIITYISIATVIFHSTL